MVLACVCLAAVFLVVHLHRFLIKWMCVSSSCPSSWKPAFPWGLGYFLDGSFPLCGVYRTIKVLYASLPRLSGAPSTGPATDSGCDECLWNSRRLSSVSVSWACWKPCSCGCGLWLDRQGGRSWVKMALLHMPGFPHWMCEFFPSQGKLPSILVLSVSILVSLLP